MIIEDVQESLIERYSHVPQLIFERTVEKAKTNGELFDLLESFPDSYPVVWCENKRKWVHTSDLLQINFGGIEF